MDNCAFSFFQQIRKYHLLAFTVFLSACTYKAPRQENPVLKSKEIAIGEKKDPYTDTFIKYIVDPQKQHVCLFWKNDRGAIYGSIQKLKEELQQKRRTLRFAMNGGMYLEDQSPQGLFMEDSKVIRPLNEQISGYGNFFMKPNGVFYLDKNKKAGVITTERFNTIKNVQWATQSGPMLVIGDTIHPRFSKNSKNLNIRNGVGILSDGKILFVISGMPVSLYDFAIYFRNQGCKNALYLDGAISQAYIPSYGRMQTGGAFGVIIGETD